MFEPTERKILCLLALDWDEMKRLGRTNERAVQTDGMLAFWFTGRQVLMYASKVCGVVSQDIDDINVKKEFFERIIPSSFLPIFTLKDALTCRIP